MFNVQKIGFAILTTTLVSLSNATPAHAGFVEDLSGAITNSIMEGIFGKKKQAPVQMSDIMMEQEAPATPSVSLTQQRQALLSKILVNWRSKAVAANYEPILVTYSYLEEKYPQLDSGFHAALEKGYNLNKSKGTYEVDLVVDTANYLRNNGYHDHEVILCTAIIIHQITIGDDTLENVLNN